MVASTWGEVTRSNAADTDRVGIETPRSGASPLIFQTGRRQLSSRGTCHYQPTLFLVDINETRYLKQKHLDAAAATRSKQPEISAMRHWYLYRLPKLHITQHIVVIRLFLMQ